MGVIVLGMDLPDSCWTCKLNGALATCRLFPDRKPNYEIRPEWCPIRYYPEIPKNDKCPSCAGKLLPPHKGMRRCGSCNFLFPESDYPYNPDCPYETFSGIHLESLSEEDKEKLLSGSWNKGAKCEDGR